MIETIGEDIFDQIVHADAVCIPTNCSIDEDLHNPMGALAGQFARRWYELSGIYGYLLKLIPNVPVILGYVNKLDHKRFVSSLKCTYTPDSSWCAIVAVPTMHTIMEPADFNLVMRSAQLLVEMANLNNWNEIYLGSPGTGIGGLLVEDVHPALAQIFNYRFTVMQK